MKQVIQYFKTGETKVVDVPVPTPKPGMVLVRTGASLVSSGTERMVVEFAEKSLIGKAQSRPDLVRQVLDKAKREGVLTTLDAVMNKLDQPLPLGYSSSGTVVAVGEGISDIQVGKRVACAGGGYAVHAEYVLVPKNLIAPLPANVDFESAAFSTIGAIALHGFRLAQPQFGESIAIIGLGLLGMLAAGIANAAGLKILGIDLDTQRVNLAQSLGINAVLRENAENIALEFSRGRGVDTVLICADTPSNDPVNLAGNIARDRANIVAIGAVGLNIPRKLYYMKELSFINSRSYGPGRYDKNYEEKGNDYPIGYVRWTEGRNLEAFIDLLSTGRFDVKKLITHRFLITQAEKAYELITGKSEETFLGVLLTYPEPKEHERQNKTKTRIQLLKNRHPHKIDSIALGVIGAGNFANAVMLPAIKDIPEIERVCIASASGLSAQHAAHKYHFSSAASNANDILSDKTIDTIAILTRHNLHAEQVTAALMAGKNVFCEKPLAINFQQLGKIENILESLNSLDKQHRPLLTVGFNRRFAPLIKEMKGFLDESDEPLTIMYRVNAGYIPLSHWVHDPAIGGGRIIGEGCHFIDLMAYLTNQTPNKVFAMALPNLGRYAEDNVQIAIGFSNGSIGTLNYFANGDKAFSKERIEVYRGGRVAILDDFRTLQMINQGRKKVMRARLRQDKGHKAIWRTFANAIINNSEPPIPYTSILGVTKATFAVIESLREQQPISIR
ncbi:MAG TPA: Gfo/Idh/MocA family oxidoreductase [Anaerolineae bacterium]|nr:Gfo/Idh/MocA family oxidoreductase [Anaerolineae bacterium]